MHHRMKQDSPSGTARRLAEILTEVRDLSYDEDVRHGRFGDVGARTKREIGMHAGNCPGYPASHGCIRMPSGEVRAFFAVLKIGDPVTITE
jgi:4-hydroxy-tetrahydrodipicolinate reductase